MWGSARQRQDHWRRGETTTDCWRFLTGDYDAQVSRNHSTHIDEGSNGGLDIAVPDGTPVYAAKSGEIVDRFDRWTESNPSPLGNFVRIDHDDGTQGVFLHLQSIERGLNLKYWYQGGRRRSDRPLE